MKTAVAKRKKAAAIQKRFSGILVHPTSFPSPYGIGDLGSGAYELLIFSKPPVSLSGSVFLWDRPVMVIPLTSPFPHLPDSLC